MVPPKNVALDPEVFARVAAEAQKEGKTPDELANEAAKRFLASRRLADLQQYGRQRASDLGLTEGDVSRLITESRAERRR
jgi:copper oxidase (laccase) domain-containing protein